MGGEDWEGRSEAERATSSPPMTLFAPSWGRSFMTVVLDTLASCLPLVSLSPSPPLLISAQTLLFTGHTERKVRFLLAHCLSLPIRMRCRLHEVETLSGSLRISNALTSAGIPDGRTQSVCVCVHVNLECILWPLALCFSWLCWDDSCISITPGFLSE